MQASIQILSGENWGPFRSFELMPGRFTAIRGENGAGKSALLDALRWVECGGTVPMAPTEDALIRAGSQKTAVVVKWSDGVKGIRSRERGRASQLRVGNALKKAAQDEIWARVGLRGKDAYTRISHVGQGEVTGLATANDSERRDTLLSWLGGAMEVWDAGRMGVLKERLDVGRERTRLRARIESVSETLAGLGSASNLSAESGERIRGLESRLMTDRNRIRELQRERAENLSAARSLERIRRELSDARIPDQFDEPEPDTPDKRVIKGIRDEIRRERDHRDGLLKVVSGEWSGSCPFVAGSTCPSSTWVHESRAEIQAGADASGTKISRLESRLRPLHATLRARSSWESRRDVAGQKIEVARARVESLEGSLEKALSRADSNRPIDRIDSDIRVLESRVKDSERELAVLRSDADTARRVQKLVSEQAFSRKRLQDLEQRHGVLNDVLGLIDGTAGPQALVGARVETRCNTMLDGTGMTLRLQWTKTLQKRVSVCPSCGEVAETNRKTCPGCNSERPFATKPDLKIMVTADGIERDIRFLSGGRKQLVCLALRLATCPTPWIVLDEVDSSMDPSLRALAGRICKLASNRIQIIMIGHHDETLNHADIIYDVVQQGGESICRAGS